MQLNEASKIAGLTSDELVVKVFSSEMLNLNVTSTLMDLYSMVHSNWMQDMHSDTNSGIINYWIIFVIINDSLRILFQV